MKKLLFPLTLIMLFSCETDLDDEAIQALLTGTNPERSAMETIAKEDTLYNYLGLVSKSSESPLTDIGCIEFIYPFVLFQFDDEDKYINQVSVQGNENFAEILDNLSEDYSISLSYPISGNLIDGTPVTVENNEQLQIALETCIEEELEIILGNCNAIATTEECVWKITQSDAEESPYIDSFFTLRGDGSVAFSILQPSEEEEENPEESQETEPEYELEIGTWIFYLIGADLHMNINFGPVEENEEGQILTGQEIKTHWNFDWKINYFDQDKIEIEKTYTKIVETDIGEVEEVFTENITLKKECTAVNEEETRSVN